MNDILWASALTLAVYIMFLCLQNRFKITLLNPLLLSAIFIIIFLLLTNLPYLSYENGTSFITFLIGPATVSLALPLYEKLAVLKKHWKIIFSVIGVGVIIHALMIFIIVFILKSSDVMIATFIPKSVTTAIAKDVSVALGGIKQLTIVIVVLTGVLGAVVAPFVFKIFKITHPIARGLSLGSAAHALGTTKAVEYGEVDASMATLSLIITGLLTVISAPLIYQIITYIL